MAFTIRSVGVVFPTSNGGVSALKDVSFTVRDSEFVSVVGPSGCGKTTLLRVIAGLLEPSEGEVAFDTARPVGALRCALVFQEHGLLPWDTVLANVALGLELARVERRQREARARAFVDQVGLAGFADAYPHELSVGMRQRVALARAFVSDPDILLLDEPFAALDAQTRLVLQEELLGIWRRHRKTVVHVTHDIEEAILLGDRLLVLGGHPGTVVEEIEVPLERPRGLGAVDRPEVTDLKWHVWRILEQQVRDSIGIGGRR